MRALVRCLLMLLLLCPPLLGGATAHACTLPAAAPQAAAPRAEHGGAHHQRASQTSATQSQALQPGPCQGFCTCAAHCAGVVATTQPGVPRREGADHPVRSLPAPAGIVLSPEPRPPRV